MGDNERAFNAATYIEQRLSTDPEFAQAWQRVQRKLRAFASALRYIHENQLSGEVISQKVWDSPEVKAARAEYQEFKSNWESEYRSQLPETIEDFARAAIRSGVDANYVMQGEWRPDDFMPIYEGYLQRLIDQTKGDGQTENDDDTPKKIKPTEKTVAIIRAIEAGKDNDQIFVDTGSSNVNTRTVRRRLKQEQYKL